MTTLDARGDRRGGAAGPLPGRDDRGPSGARRAQPARSGVTAARVVALVGLASLLAGCAMSRATLRKTTDRCIVKGFSWAQVEVIGQRAGGSADSPAAYITPDARIFTPADDGPPDKQIGRFHEDGRIELTWPDAVTSQPLRVESGEVVFTGPEDFIFSPGCTAPQVAVGVAAYQVIGHRQIVDWREQRQREREEKAMWQ